MSAKTEDRTEDQVLASVRDGSIVMDRFRYEGAASTQEEEEEMEKSSAQLEENEGENKKVKVQT